MDIHETSSGRRTHRSTRDSGYYIRESVCLEPEVSAFDSSNFLQAENDAAATDEEPVSDVDAEVKVKRDIRVRSLIKKMYQGSYMY